MGVRVNPLEPPPLPTGLTNLHCHAHWARSHFDTLIIILQLVHPAHTLTLCTPHFPCTPFTQMAFLLVQVLCSCCFLMKVCCSSGSAVTSRMKWPATYLGPMHAVIPPALWSPFLSTCSCGAGYMLGKTKKKKMSRRSPLVSSPIYPAWMSLAVQKALFVLQATNWPEVEEIWKRAQVL